MSLYKPPINHIVAALLVLAGLGSAARSAQLIRRGLRLGRPLEVVRGIRLYVLALVAGLLAVGLLSGSTGFVVTGAIILGEEL